jgi:hypothetical protein
LVKAGQAWGNNGLCYISLQNKSAAGVFARTQTHMPLAPPAPRLPPGAAARRAAQHGRLLTCHLAGPVQPTPDGLLYLRQLQGSGVHRLRLLSIVDAADQTWTSGGASAAAASADAAAGSQLQLGPAGACGGGGGAAAPPMALTEQPAGARAWPLEPVGAAKEQAAGPMLWGELYAREPRRGLAALLPQRRGDVAERLIARVRRWAGAGRLFCLGAAARPPLSGRLPPRLRPRLSALEC